MVLPRLQRRESLQQSEGDEAMGNLQTPDNNDKNNKSRARNNVTLVCDQCGAENWNMAGDGKSHGQPANPVKGYEACAGVWRLPRVAPDRQPGGVVIQFPQRVIYASAAITTA
jgi:hypothetical protein